MHYVDSHAHLYFDRFDEDRSEVLARAREAGFVHVINVGIDVATSEAAIQLALENPGFCYASAGLHPNDTAHEPDELASILGQLEKLIEQHRDVVCAYGEIGLDYYWDHSPPEKQAVAFRAQLDLAEKHDLPVIIHCRDAMADTLPIVEEYGSRTRGVFHCFSGNAEEAKRSVELGWHVSFAGNVTFPKAPELREAAAVVPPDRLLLETDAPFLSPQAVRGQRNEPVHSLHTLEVLAETIGMSPEDLGAQTTANSCRLFRLPGTSD